MHAQMNRKKRDGWRKLTHILSLGLISAQLLSPIQAAIADSESYTRAQLDEMMRQFTGSSPAAPAPAPAAHTPSPGAVKVPGVAPKLKLANKDAATKDGVNALVGTLSAVQNSVTPSSQAGCIAPEPAKKAENSTSAPSAKNYYYPGKGALASLNSQYALKKNKYFTHEIPSREDLKAFIDSIPVHPLADNGAWKNCRKGITDGFPQQGQNYEIYRNKHWVSKSEKYGPLSASKTAVVGNVSIFGGPLDSGVGLGEGGALDSRYLRLRGWNWKPEKKGNLTHYALDRSKPANPDYYCAMRFNYRQKKPKDWLKKRIFIYDPVNKTGVICQPADWGPSDTETNKMADLSPASLAALGRKDGSAKGLKMSYADDNAPIGPVENSCTPGTVAQVNHAADDVPLVASN